MANHVENSIKACPGTQCQRGLQDAVAVQLMLDEHPRVGAAGEVRVGVSGCPHRCAENGFRDVCLVGTEKGWEIYVQDNEDAGRQLAEPLAKDLSTERALILIDCVLAYFRENAQTGEGIGCVIRRLGYGHLRKSLEL